MPRLDSCRDSCCGPLFLSAILALVAGVPVSAPRGVAQTNVTWQGGSGTSYGNALNWSPQVVPLNAGANAFNVFIPANQSVLMNIDGSYEVTDLALAAGATLTIAPGESLTVRS